MHLQLPNSWVTNSNNCNPMLRGIFSIKNIKLSTASSGRGRSFLFQHGLCGSASQPLEVFPQDIGWRCLTLECRGHGMSEIGPHSKLSIRRFTDDLAAFISELNIGPVLVGGISMGAAITLRLAVKYPELVSGLVVARPAWIDQSAPENLAPNREVARYLATYEPAEALLQFERSVLAAELASDAPDNLASLLGFFKRTPAAETQVLQAAIANDGPGVNRAEIAGLDCPTLVIGTERDVTHPIAMAREIADLIPNARFVEITSKADNVEQYRAEFQNALRHFTMEID